MGLGLKTFEMPKRLECDESVSNETYGRFVAEPFERGFGITIGNSLRRVLISSLEGAAVSSIKLDGALHEFSSLPGVVEDVTEIILNVKNLVVRSHSNAPQTITIDLERSGAVTAEDIKTTEAVEVVNPDLHIATLSKKARFKIEMEVTKGRGYAPAEKNKKENQPVGVIAIDSIYSPVRRVQIHSEDTRVGQLIGYDKLILDIWTNGSITPKDAILYGSNILQRHLDVFAHFGKLPLEEEEETATSGQTGKEEELYKKLNQPVTELELSVRSANCLREAKIKNLADLVIKTEAEMLKYRNFGKKSLAEISNYLKSMGLSFGMTLDEEKVKPGSKE